MVGSFYFSWRLKSPGTIEIISNAQWFRDPLGAGGEGDDRGWDGWMASPTRWTWVWVNSWSWWWTQRTGMLRFMGSQRVGHDWVTELSRTKLGDLRSKWCLIVCNDLGRPNLRMISWSSFFFFFLTTSSAFSVQVGKPSIHPVNVSIMANRYLCRWETGIWVKSICQSSSG